MSQSLVNHNKYNNTSNNNTSNTSNTSNNNKSSNVYNVVEELQDYMFTNTNFTRYIKDIYTLSSQQNKTRREIKETNTNTNTNTNTTQNIRSNNRTDVKKCDLNNYKPLKKDSLFWCFFIIKYGFAKYEMEIGSQHFIIEKNEKFANIDLLRTKENKDLLKINKIKPLSDLEDELANKERISIKTFFALCIIEKMNVLLVDNRKIYQSINNDSSIINVIHRNSQTFEHYIELNVSDETITKYKDTYYNISGFDNALKSMSAYKVDELLEICKQLNINLNINAKSNSDKTKKLTKKDLYELIVQNF